MTVSERKLWLLLFSNFKYRILRQRPIDNYIVDFYCPKLKLVVEIDGESHYTDDGKTYDEVRTYVLEGYGLKVLRIMFRVWLIEKLILNHQKMDIPR